MLTSFVFLLIFLCVICSIISFVIMLAVDGDAISVFTTLYFAGLSVLLDRYIESQNSMILLLAVIVAVGGVSYGIYYYKSI